MPEWVRSGSGNRIGTARSADCTMLGAGVRGVNGARRQEPSCGRILTPDRPPPAPPFAAPLMGGRHGGGRSGGGGPHHLLSTFLIHNTEAIVENCGGPPLDP